MTKQSGMVGGARRADGHKFPNAVTQSSQSRTDKDTKTPKEAEIYQWPCAGPSLTPVCLQSDRTGLDLWLEGGLAGFRKRVSGLFLASQNYTWSMLYLLLGCLKKQKDEIYLHEIEPLSLVKETGLSLELHQRSTPYGFCKAYPVVEPRREDAHPLLGSF